MAYLIGKAGARAAKIFEVGFGAPIPIVNHQVDRHLPLETGDVAMAEVVAEVMHLSSEGTKAAGQQTRKEHKGPHIPKSQLSFSTVRLPHTGKQMDKQRDVNSTLQLMR